ncbi:methyltransferase domain-containing protein [Amycolatopsis sp. NPDC049159]|uniref:class I SAM-dependent methyltransferase n=1 Tax=Amycolatopsis sp. NPDC049159 TaxID=3157210 RepID=UPI0033D8011F
MTQETEQAADTEQVIGRLWERNYDPGTRGMITGLGIRPDWRCLDLGAGLGSMSRWLAGQVPRGSVLALDRDTTALAGVAADNLTVRQADLAGADFPDGSFDLVLARAVLSYLPDPEAVLDRVHRWLAPGGYLVAEDFYFMPSDDCATPLGRRVVEGYAKAAAGAGLDWRLARRLPSLLARTGFEAVEQTVRPLGPGQGEEENELMRARMNLQGAPLVENGLVSAEDVAEFVATLDRPEVRDVTTLLFSVRGRR